MNLFLYIITFIHGIHVYILFRETYLKIEITLYLYINFSLRC